LAVGYWDADEGKATDVDIFDTATWRRQVRLQGHHGGIFGLAFDPSGQHLASGGLDKDLRVWDVESGKTLKTFKTQTAHFSGVAFSPDGKFLAAAIGEWDDFPSTRDGQVVVWD